MPPRVVEPRECQSQKTEQNNQWGGPTKARPLAPRGPLIATRSDETEVLNTPDDAALGLAAGVEVWVHGNIAGDEKLLTVRITSKTVEMMTNRRYFSPS